MTDPFELETIGPGRKYDKALDALLWLIYLVVLFTAPAVVFLAWKQVFS